MSNSSILNRIPFHPNYDCDSEFPHDIDKILAAEYSAAEIIYEKKYNGQYLEEKLVTVQKSLHKKKATYESYFYEYVNQFMQECASGKSICKINIIMYGDLDLDQRRRNITRLCYQEFLLYINDKGLSI